MCHCAISRKSSSKLFLSSMIEIFPFLCNFRNTWRSYIIRGDCWKAFLKRFNSTEKIQDWMKVKRFKLKIILNKKVWSYHLWPSQPWLTLTCWNLFREEVEAKVIDDRRAVSQVLFASDYINDSVSFWISFNDAIEF